MTTTAWTSGDAITDALGIASPDELATAWAAACAAAVSAAIDTLLADDHELAGIDPDGEEWAEITRAATVAGVYAYKQRDAPLGVSTFSDLEGAAIRLARDYIDAIRPILDRYARPGIG